MSGTPRISVEVAEPLQISPRELAAALEEGEKLALLDARTLEEYDAGN